MSDQPSRNPTRVDAPTSRARETKYQPGPGNFADSRSDNSAARSNVQDNRKIVGVLASYSRRAEGEIFAVREGRTHIGAGLIKEDTSHRAVDVQYADDPLMSEDHAMILVQQKMFWIRDLDSTNGTSLNDKPLRPDGAEELPNNAKIKVGNTVFTFLKIEPKAGGVTEARQEQPKANEDEPEVPFDPKKTILK